MFLFKKLTIKITYNKMDLSILVVTYNTKDLIEKCIQSVLNYIGSYKIEIIVVDNNSSDGTSEFIKSKYSQIKFIQNQFNYGFAVGMNQAYKIASGRYVMTFNPDAEIFNLSIDAAIQFLDENPDTGLLGMLTEDSQGTIEIPYHDFSLIEKIETLRLFFSSTNKKIVSVNNVIEVNWIWGTSIFARKKELGSSFFIEDNFLFWEEYWLVKKIKAQGLKIKILLNCKMLHHISASFKSDYQKLEIVRVLSIVNGHSAKINEFGTMRTFLSYFVKVVDHLLMFLILNCLSLFKNTHINERKLSIINHQALLKAYFNLLLFGKKYRSKYQLFAVKKLNHNLLPFYPPVTFS